MKRTLACCHFPLILTSISSQATGGERASDASESNLMDRERKVLNFLFALLTAVSETGCRIGASCLVSPRLHSHSHLAALYTHLPRKNAML
ncbi:hypothetical protein PBY51_015617 [Eleginops maclovinus]|uniref:Uncharacterized protein n=1 Tax=Eleginops maclovinus TaxID=56733 RepID=A0AAN7XP85_ELEMC|nr:hypothetical protein PBY51_015617 [Eleginops maclovinus]